LIEFQATRASARRSDRLDASTYRRNGPPSHLSNRLVTPPPLQPPRCLVRLRLPDRPLSQRPRPASRGRLPKVSHMANVARPRRPSGATRRPCRQGSSVEQARLTRCARFRPGWLLIPAFRPPARVLPRPGYRSHRGRVRRTAPRGGGPSGPLRSRPCRLSTTRPRTSSGFDRPLPCPSEPHPCRSVRVVFQDRTGDRLPAPRTVFLL
jgi:hypothetical protein